MALTDKLTAIANAIRGKTGGAAELTLPQMAEEIEAKLSGKSVSFVVNVPTTVSTSGTYTIFEANDQNALLNELLAAHRSDSNFTIAITPLSAVPDQTNGFRRLWIASNSQLFTDGGIACCSSVVTEKAAVLTITAAANKPTGSGSVSVSNVGAIGVYANSSGRIGAGDYLISCSWAEAESEV